MNMLYYDTGARPGEMNMAVDEVLLQVPDPVLRFYQWSRRAITIGRFQSWKEINIQEADKENIHVIRRETGGKGVFHGDDLTISLILPTAFVPESVKNAVQLAGRGIVLGLQLLGLEAQQVTESEHHTSHNHNRKSTRLSIHTSHNYNRKSTRSSIHISSYCFSAHSPYEVIIGHKKIAGIALRRYKEKALYQISLPLIVHTKAIHKYFIRKPGEGSIPVEETGLKDLLHSAFSPDAVIHSLASGIKQVLGFQLLPVQLTSRLVTAASCLVKSKYSQKEWNFSR